MATLSNLPMQGLAGSSKARMDHLAASAAQLDEQQALQQLKAIEKQLVDKNGHSRSGFVRVLNSRHSDTGLVLEKQSRLFMAFHGNRNRETGQVLKALMEKAGIQDQQLSDYLQSKIAGGSKLSVATLGGHLQRALAAKASSQEAAAGQLLQNAIARGPSSIAVAIAPNRAENLPPQPQPQPASVDDGPLVFRARDRAASMKLPQRHGLGEGAAHPMHPQPSQARPVDGAQDALPASLLRASEHSERPRASGARSSIVQSQDPVADDRRAELDRLQSMWDGFVETVKERWDEVTATAQVLGRTDEPVQTPIWQRLADKRLLQHAQWLEERQDLLQVFDGRPDHVQRLQGLDRTLQEMATRLQEQAGHFSQLAEAQRGDNETFAPLFEALEEGDYQNGCQDLAAESEAVAADLKELAQAFAPVRPDARAVQSRRQQAVDGLLAEFERGWRQLQSEGGAQSLAGQGPEELRDLQTTLFERLQNQPATSSREATSALMGDIQKVRAEMKDKLENLQAREKAISRLESSWSSAVAQVKADFGGQSDVGLALDGALSVRLADIRALRDKVALDLKALKDALAQKVSGSRLGEKANDPIGNPEVARILSQRLEIPARITASEAYQLMHDHASKLVGLVDGRSTAGAPSSAQVDQLKHMLRPESTLRRGLEDNLKQILEAEQSRYQMQLGRAQSALSRAEQAWQTELEQREMGLNALELELNTRQADLEALGRDEQAVRDAWAVSASRADPAIDDQVEGRLNAIRDARDAILNGQPGIMDEEAQDLPAEALARLNAQSMTLEELESTRAELSRLIDEQRQQRPDDADIQALERDHRRILQNWTDAHTQLIDRIETLRSAPAGR